jgi:PIN domain nuclease of toxin-antitoxin system
LRLLLDTHIALWLVSDDPRMPRAARSAIEDASASVVSAVSIWEVAIKRSTGRVDIDVDRLMQRLEAAGVEHLDVSWRHARLVEGLPHHHRDPFDRLLVAQAVVEPLHLLTHDRTLGRYGDFVQVV